MGSVKSWKRGEAGEPDFPEDFEIVQKAVLQVTDIKTNRNKYYAIELHVAGANYRVYTHYGRTDDLDSNPNSGQKECRYFASLQIAQANYQSIYNEKTSARKGYKELSLASSNIGSEKARGTGSGDVDAKTMEKLKSKDKDVKKPVVQESKLSVAVQSLVRYLYDEAKGALTTNVNAKITANGIETPLGILTIGQIEKGEEILTELYDLFNKKNVKNRDERIKELSSDFYTVVPHRIGRTRAAVEAAVINSLADFQQKQETLQLMKDMLNVNGEAGNVLFDAQVDQEYEALGCEIRAIEKGSDEYLKMQEHVIASQVKTKTIKVQSIYGVQRKEEWNAFTTKIDNQRHLFHGSRIGNWVGILSRGILLPKIVVSMGVNRTDAGWLGHGIYFGDASCTSAFYTTPGKKKTRFMAVARVALGKMKDYHKITYGLSEPPSGFQSCHGVRREKNVTSEFDDNEYVIYDGKQQRQEYLVEFTV
jgi:poly [ADP-ribose] polymerase 2/3/4